MKIILLTVILSLTSAVKCFSASTPDAEAQTLWQQLSTSNNFHFFDNGGAGYYLDVVKGRHQSLGGVNTTVYEPTKYHTSIDANVAGYQNGQLTKGFAFPSLTYHWGELTSIQKLESKFLHQDNLQLNSGFWFARDWDAGLWRGGFYSNLSYFWGS